MKHFSLIIAFVVLSHMVIGQNQAPTDYTLNSVVTMTNDQTYIQLSNNQVLPIDQTGWDIAVYNHQNEVGGKANTLRGAKLWRVYRDTTQFSTVTLNDTTNPVVDNDSFMYYGGLDTIYTGESNSWFNIGLGRLTLGTTVATRPTRMYIIRRSNGSFGKLFLREYASRKYQIVYADIDNLNPRVLTISKVVPAVDHYQFIDLGTGSVSNSFEPKIKSWTLSGRKGANGSPMHFLTNNAHNMLPFAKTIGAITENIPSFYFVPVSSTEAYTHLGDPLTAAYNGSLQNTSVVRNYAYDQIGSSWYNATTAQPRTGVSYFLRDNSYRIWHLIFTNYNSSSKELFYAFRQVGSASVSSYTNQNIYSLSKSGDGYAVSCSDASIESNAQVVSIEGKLISTHTFRRYLTIPNTMARGLYLIKLSNSNSEQTFKFLVD